METHSEGVRVNITMADKRNAEWKNGWALVLAAAAGFAFYSILPNAMGLFVQPLSDEFGWSHAQVYVGMSITSVVTIFLSPFVGALIDRVGVRKVALPGLALASLSISSLALADGGIVQWMSLWIVLALVLLLIKATVWTAAITATFDEARSLAIAFAISGTAFASVIVPPLSQLLIASFGWRTAFVLLGLGYGSIAFIMSALFLYDAHDRKVAASTIAPVLSGLSLKQAFATPALVKIGLACFLTMFVGVGVAVNQVPIIVKAGVTREDAAYLASLYGVSGILGKFVTGWLMDKFHAGMIGGFTLLVAALSYLLLLEQVGSISLIMLGLVLIGYSNGSKLQICAYLTGVYGGVKNYGKIFGVMSSGIALGGGLGPMVVGMFYDASGSYTYFMLLAVVVTFIAACLLFSLGPVPKRFQG